MKKKRFVKLLMADCIGRNSVTEYVRFITRAAHATFDYENLYHNLKRTEYVQEVHSIFPNGENINIETIGIGKKKCIGNFSDDFKKFLDVLNAGNGELNG